MIVKSLSRKSNTGQLVNYVFKYVFREQEKTTANPKPEKSDKGKFIIKHNMRSRSVKGFVKEFQENEKYRVVHRKDSIKLFHTIISFSNKDKEHINDKILKDIAKKFIEERGLNNLYAGTKHEDKDHIHLHIAISGTQLNGRSSRISKQKFHSIKLALQNYQQKKYPQLVNSLPEHGKAKRLEKEAKLQMIKTERQTDKQALIECLEKAYSSSKSQEQFISKIIESGHKPYYRNGSLQGVRFEGQMKFRFSRINFNKNRLQALDKIKASQDKTLNELKNLREGRNKEQKRSIAQSPAVKRISVNPDRNEKQPQELSATRNTDDSKEHGGGDTNVNHSIAPAEDEFKDREPERNENEDLDNEPDSNTNNDEEENNDTDSEME